MTIDSALAETTRTTVMTVSPNARDKVLELRAAEPDADDLALWVEVTGAQGRAYTYDLYFASQAEATDEEIIEDHDGLALVLRAEDVDRLTGATLDMNRDLLAGGMVIQNPNTPPPVSAAPAPTPAFEVGELTGTVDERINQLLDRVINPSLASHGGFAELVGVEGTSAYVRMSGGCQGCGMAKMTLSQGIKTAIVEHIDEIADVVDVTDHAAGENPFYN